MNAKAPGRGGELVAGGRHIGIGPGWFARIFTGGIRRVLDRIDRGIVHGSAEVTLPNGETRLLGGRADGFHARLEIRDLRGVMRFATGGSVGFYQAWAGGEIASPDLVEVFALVMQNGESLGRTGRAHGPWKWIARHLHRLHRNTRNGSLRNIHAHYDLGNDFYPLWLDPTMSYSSARFDTGSDDLEAAQQRKIASMADRIAGAQNVLEIGCGWGSLAGELSQRGMDVTAISLSDAQLAWARAHQPKSIDFLKVDYRDMAGKFDAVVSVEMVEAVGREYWPAFLDTVARCLVPGGRAAIQYILMQDELFDGYAANADFIQTYIFPGGLLIRESEFRALADARGLAWTDRESFGLDYARTLQIWRENFDRVEAAGALPPGFDRDFADLWRFYLMYCEGGFRGGGIDVAQVTLVKKN